MKQTYYVREYRPEQWKALVAQAEKIGVKVSYNKYADRAELDSTDLETSLISGLKDPERYRADWAGHIHAKLQEAAEKCCIVL